MPTSCPSTALVLMLNTTFTSACSEDKPAEPTNFKAIALVLKDDVYRLWIRPNSDDAARKKAESVTCSWQYYVLPVRGCHWLSEPSGHFTIDNRPHGERSQCGAGFTIHA